MRQRTRRTREPTIALINIVFLMLVFFLVAGTLARPLEGGLTLVKTRGLDGAAPPDALVIHPDGALSFHGAPITEAAFLAELPEGAQEVLRLVPDRDLPARALVSLAARLRAGGAGRIVIVTERGLP